MQDAAAPIIPMQPVESSQIEAIGHDASTGTLAVRFKGRDSKPGSLYHYANVTTDDFAAFKGAESIGSHFYKHIKPFAERYPYQRINEAPATEAKPDTQAAA